jgi:ribonuclease Y
MLSFVVTAGASLLWRRGRVARELAHHRARAQEIVATATSEAQQALVLGDERAAAEQGRLAEVQREEAARLRAEVGEYEAEVELRGHLVANRECALDERQMQHDSVRSALMAVESDTANLGAQAAVGRGQCLAALEQKSGQAAGEVSEQLVREAIEKVELNVLMRLREAEALQNEVAAAESRRVMQTAMERYDGASHLERVHSSIVIEEPQTFAVLADPHGPCRLAFCEETGCELVHDEALQTVTVRGDDPLAREIARRVLGQLGTLRVSQVDKVRTLAHQTRAKVEREVQNAGRKALRALEVGRVHPEVLQLVGRLKFRLSYSQNQWRHSIEVGLLAGLMAEELGLDVVAARRSGLLHDIGKAMTHDHDGSHATLGAEVARRCGEDEVVVNAIASHHNDEPPRTPIAFIVAAADALSGGRPGARRESVTQYLARIQDIQRIANLSSVVKRVDIMQAGREVRVVVAGADHGSIDPADRHGGPSLQEADLQPLAREIAQRIENELTFAGQIKVTVIRESRAVAVAH